MAKGNADKNRTVEIGDFTPEQQRIIRYWAIVSTKAGNKDEGGSSNLFLPFVIQMLGLTDESGKPKTYDQPTKLFCISCVRKVNGGDWSERDLPELKAQIPEDACTMIEAEIEKKKGGPRPPVLEASGVVRSPAPEPVPPPDVVDAADAQAQGSATQAPQIPAQIPAPDVRSEPAPAAALPTPAVRVERPEPAAAVTPTPAHRPPLARSVPAAPPRNKVLDLSEGELIERAQARTLTEADLELLSKEGKLTAAVVEALADEDDQAAEVVPEPAPRPRRERRVDRDASPHAESRTTGSSEAAAASYNSTRGAPSKNRVVTTWRHLSTTGRALVGVAAVLVLTLVIFLFTRGSSSGVETKDQLAGNGTTVTPFQQPQAPAPNTQALVDEAVAKALSDVNAALHGALAELGETPTGDTSQLVQQLALKARGQQGQITQLLTSLADAEKRAATPTGPAASESSTVATLRTENTELKTENGRLRGQISTLQTSLTESQANLVAAQRRATNSAAPVTPASPDPMLATLRDENSTLRTENGRLQTRITAYQQFVDGVTPYLTYNTSPVVEECVGALTPADLNRIRQINLSTGAGWTEYGNVVGPLLAERGKGRSYRDQRVTSAGGNPDAVNKEINRVVFGTAWLDLLKTVGGPSSVAPSGWAGETKTAHKGSP